MLQLLCGGQLLQTSCPAAMRISQDQGLPHTGCFASETSTHAHVHAHTHAHTHTHARMHTHTHNVITHYELTDMVTHAAPLLITN